MYILLLAAVLIGLVWALRHRQTACAEPAAVPADDCISSLPRWDDYQRGNFTHDTRPRRDASDDIDEYCRRLNGAEVEDEPGELVLVDPWVAWDDELAREPEQSRGFFGRVKHTYDDGDFQVIFDRSGRMIWMYAGDRWWDFRD